MLYIAMFCMFGCFGIDASASIYDLSAGTSVNAPPASCSSPGAERRIFFSSRR
jgi:hypothetical protein